MKENPDCLLLAHRIVEEKEEGERPVEPNLLGSLPKSKETFNLESVTKLDLQRTPLGSGVKDWERKQQSGLEGSIEAREAF